ncbi:MAG: nucleotidyltransferase [Patescibacteria group bacterium]|nr:nucleotidyltransferase [Patescibacteria group bacterium]
MAIQKQFEKFYANIKLTSVQREDARRKYDGVCKKLHDNYYPEIEYNGSTRLLIGSYGKQTHIRPARDIDVIFIMPSEKFDQYDDNQSNCQSQLLQDIKKILEEKYPDTPIRASGKVVILEFSDSQHQVELLPAWENEDKTFKIPNSENGGSWEGWDPRSEIQGIKDSDTKTGDTKALIRMIKKWTERCSVEIKSYKIENEVLNFFHLSDLKYQFYSILVRDFFAFFYDNASDEDLKSHLKTVRDRAQKAYSFEEEGKINKATDEWKKIFGDDFPKEEEQQRNNFAPSNDQPGPIVNPPKPHGY